MPLETTLSYYYVNLQVLHAREQEANLYSPFAYWATHALIHLPFLALTLFAFGEPAYWIIGMSATIFSLA